MLAAEISSIIPMSKDQPGNKKQIYNMGKEIADKAKALRTLAFIFSMDLTRAFDREKFFRGICH